LENSEKKSVKFRKIQPKRTGDDEGTVEIGNTENRHGDFRVNQPRRFVPETGQYLLKIGKWNKKNRGKQCHDIY
jgi:hypothetical protein